MLCVRYEVNLNKNKAFYSTVESFDKREVMIGGKTFYCGLMLITAFFGVNTSNNKWVAPDAWGLSESSRDAKGTVDCPVCTGCLQNSVCNTEKNKSIASIFYGKFIKFIFNRNRMVYDDNSESYTRTIIFKITSTQLDLIEKSTDPRDWDSVLAEVLPNTEFPEQFIQNDFIANIFASTKLYIFNFFISSEARFTLILLTSILLIVYINRKYKYGLICTGVSACFLFGLIYSYYECNRELEIRELAHIMDTNEDPCADMKQQDEGYWNYFKIKPSKQHCVQYLINKHKIKLPYCKPEDVILKYFHNIVFDQIFLTVEKSIAILKKIFDQMSFPYNIVAVLFFGLTAPQFIKLTFKYMLSATVWRTNGNTSAESRDQISGENLKILLESVKKRNEKPSGIQIIHSIRSKSTSDLTLDQHENLEEMVDAKKVELEKLPS